MPETDAAVDHHKSTAASCNNAAWDLIETPDLTTEQQVRLVTLAATARFHWEQVGQASAVAHADLLLGWALARAGAALPACDRTQKALRHFKATEAAPWELAFAHAAMAQAAVSANQPEIHARHWHAAETLGAELEGPDAKYFTAAFKTVPLP